MKLQLHLADALEMMDQIKKLPKQYYLGDGVCPAFLDAQIAATFVQRRSGVACTWSWGGGSSGTTAEVDRHTKRPHKLGLHVRRRQTSASFPINLLSAPPFCRF